MTDNHGGEVLYTVTDVARILQMNDQTVRRYCRDGDIDAIKVGVQWRIPASALSKMLDEHPPREGDIDSGFQRFRIS